MALQTQTRSLTYLYKVVYLYTNSNRVVVSVFCRIMNCINCLFAYRAYVNFLMWIIDPFLAPLTKCLYCACIRTLSCISGSMLCIKTVWFTVYSMVTCNCSVCV